MICAIAERWNGTNGGGWALPESNYSEYLSKCEVNDLIHNFATTHISSFDEIELLKLDSFMLEQNKEKGELDNEADAQIIVDKWKND